MVILKDRRNNKMIKIDVEAFRTGETILYGPGNGYPEIAHRILDKNDNVLKTIVSSPADLQHVLDFFKSYNPNSTSGGMRGGATYMTPEFYKGGMLDSLRTGTMTGYDPMDGKLATVGGAKKKRVTKKKTTSKKSVKKVTKKKSTKKVSKKKRTKKVESSWKFW